MANEESGERTEEATQARREDFRKRGQVANSRELGSTLFLLVALGCIFALSRFYFSEIYQIMSKSFGPGIVQAGKSGDVVTAFKAAGSSLMLLVAPIALVTVIIGIASSVLQTGFLQVEDALTPKWEKINPLEGFKRLFSLRNLAEGVKSILKLIFVGLISYLVLKNEIYRIPFFINASISEILSFMGIASAKLLGGVGMSMAVLTVGDYFFQRWDLEKRMMMTKQEVKEEHKTREGDPLIKSRIRRIQRDLANRRMMEKVPQADVIITNPTHIAVALKYDASLPAPQLIAKGADLVAEKIRGIAKEHRIPIVENKPLARTIWKTMKIGQVIPRELFVAVAEVLSYVYKLKRKVMS